MFNDDEEVLEQPKTEDLKAFREELDSLKSELQETRENEKYWREEAQRGRGSAREEEPEEEEADEEPDFEDIELDTDLLELATSGDKKGFAKAIFKVAEKAGFVNGKKVGKMIQETAGNLARRQVLLEKFPEMQDPKSEFHKTADRHHARLVAKFGDRGIATIEEAAEQAARDLGYEAEEAPRRGSRRDRDDDDEREERRQQRVERQQGSRGRSERGREGGEVLERHQSRLIANLQAVGAPITAEGYIKRAGETGVQMAGISRGGSRGRGR